MTLGSTSKTNGFVFSYFFAEKFKVCLEVEMNTPFDVSNVTPLTGKVTRHGLQHMGLFLRVGNRHIIESLWHYCLNVPERE